MTALLPVTRITPADMAMAAVEGMSQRERLLLIDRIGAGIVHPAASADLRRLSQRLDRHADALDRLPLGALLEHTGVCPCDCLDAGPARPPIAQAPVPEGVSSLPSGAFSVPSVWARLRAWHDWFEQTWVASLLAGLCVVAAFAMFLFFGVILK